MEQYRDKFISEYVRDESYNFVNIMYGETPNGNKFLTPNGQGIARYLYEEAATAWDRTALRLSYYSTHWQKAKPRAKIKTITKLAIDSVRAAVITGTKDHEALEAITAALEEKGMI